MEKIVEAPAMVAPAMLPASTMALNMDKRFYILSGQPQFFGKLDALRSPVNSMVSLQPLQQLKARSADALPAEIETTLVNTAPQEVLQLSHIPPVAPLQAGAALQLRSSLSEPLQPLEIEPQQPQMMMINNEPADPESAASPLMPYMAEARSQNNEASAENKLASDEYKEMIRLDAVAQPMNLNDEPSVAQAKPTGIALAGKGGVASSAPIGTAVAGDGGLALASPSATAVSGDFSDDEEEKKFDKME